MWSDEKFVAFDFETSGELPEYALQPWRVDAGKAWATSLVWLQKTNGSFDIHGGLNPTREMMQEFLEDAIAHKKTIVGWNTVFDIQWLIAYGFYDLVMKCDWIDGMLLWKHYFIEPEYDMNRGSKKSYSLKACVAEHLPNHAGYEEDIDFHDPDPEVRKRLHDYNVKDVLFTLKLSRKFYKTLTAQQLAAARIEARCLPMIAKANLDGMVVDTIAAHDLQSTLDKTAEERLTQLSPHGVTEKIVRSPVQLSTLMFDVWDLMPLKTNTSTKTGKVSRSTDKETLHELAFVDPRCKLLREYREALGNKTKFADTPLASAAYNEDGRTRPQAMVFGTYSGRLTYGSKQGKGKTERPTGFALHQEKRGAAYRNLIIAPPGHTLVEFDASGQEFRWMAIAAADPVMLELCSPGEDPHSYMGAQIMRQDYRELVDLVHDKDSNAMSARQLGKVANLSLQYRTSAKKLRSVARVQYSIPMELGMAQTIYATYQRTYRRVPRYWETQIKETKDKGFVETFAGRRVQVRGNWNGSLEWSMGSTAINYRIQGTGADQKYLAMAVIRNKLVEYNAYFAWDLHDGIYLYIPDSKVEKAVVELREMLNNLPYARAWGFVPPIPLPWDCKAGKAWGSLEEIKL